MCPCDHLMLCMLAAEVDQTAVVKAGGLVRATTGAGAQSEEERQKAMLSWGVSTQDAAASTMNVLIAPPWLKALQAAGRRQAPNQAASTHRPSHQPCQLLPQPSSSRHTAASSQRLTDSHCPRPSLGRRSPCLRPHHARGRKPQGCLAWGQPQARRLAWARMHAMRGYTVVISCCLAAMPRLHCFGAPPPLPTYPDLLPPNTLLAWRAAARKVGLWLRVSRLHDLCRGGCVG